MGYIRIALASSVLFGHFLPNGLSVLPANAAVQGFFLISGFYIFLILDTKYAKASTFYLNRALRIYPSYLFVLGCALTAAMLLGAAAHYLTLGEMISRYGQMSWPSAAFLLFTNLTMICQDWVMYLYIDGGKSLAWTPTFYREADPAYRMLIVPQAWSLGIEIAFYMLAPFLVRLKTHSLIILVVCSFSARLYVYFRGLPYYADPWNYRFFPFEVSLFVIGGLMYRASVQFRSHVTNPRIANTLTIMLLAYCAGFALLTDARYHMFVIKYDVFIAMLAISLPFLYRGQSFKGVNKFLGELSYPIYINHLFVMNLIFVFKPNWSNQYLFFVTGVGGSVMLAVVMTKYIEETIDNLRQKIARRAML